MTDIDLDAIRARVDAATPGPWWITDGPAYGADDVVRSGFQDVARVHRRDDSVFLVHVRDDVRRMADALAAVLALHAGETWGGSNYCRHCRATDQGAPVDVPYPCPTVGAITAHLAPADSPTTED